MGTKCRNQVFYVWLVHLHSICAKYGLLTWVTPNNDIRKCLFDMQRSWTKNAFWDVNNKKWRKWCKFFLLSYLIILMPYLCSQGSPNVQIKYFMFDGSIYRLFVLNTDWEHDFLQMMILVYVCSTCSVVELKTLFEVWKARSDVNGVYWFHFSYSINVLALDVTFQYAHNRHQLSKSSSVCLIGVYWFHFCCLITVLAHVIKLDCDHNWYQ
jgi:hypothetical protein